MSNQNTKRRRVQASLIGLTVAISLLTCPGFAIAQDRRPPGWDRKQDRWVPPGQARKWDRNGRRDDRRDRDNDWSRWQDRDNDRWRRNNDESDHRQQTKNNWRNLSILAGGAAIYGYLKHDPTIMFTGLAGSLYSLNRYEQDRRSQSAADRARADIFAHSRFERDGHRYERRLVTRNGQRFYQFVRS
jgi:hypothetical protein